MTYRLVRDLAAEIVLMGLIWRVLGFLFQALYAWNKNPMMLRDPIDACAIKGLIGDHGNVATFGYSIFADELERSRNEIEERRVWRLCSQRKPWSTIQKKGCKSKRLGAAVNDDLLGRDFAARESNGKLLTDLTQHFTAESKVDCYAIRDLFSNRIVRYAVSDRMTEDLAVTALRIALTRRELNGVAIIAVIIHADTRSCFRACSFNVVLKEGGHQGSAVRVGSPGDKAAMASLRACL